MFQRLTSDSITYRAWLVLTGFTQEDSHIEALDWYTALALVGAYILGNLSLSYIWVKLWLKQDLRKIGSGSLGARNASRVLGKKGFVATFLFDVAKGSAAVVLLKILTDNELLAGLAAVLVVAGHVWPIVFGFKGGKGLSTIFGAYLVVDPLIPLYFLTTSFLIYIVLRNTVLSGLLGFLVLPILMLVLDFSYSYYLPAIIGELIVIWAHRTNIKDQFALFRANRADN